MNKCIYKPGSVSTAIYLGARSPVRSSHLLGEAGQAHIPLHGVAPDRGYRTELFPVSRCALTAPFHPYRMKARFHAAVYLCCPFPKVAFGRRYLLSSPYGARTFLTQEPFASKARLSNTLISKINNPSYARHFARRRYLPACR